jgi:hypothetical protein
MHDRGVPARKHFNWGLYAIVVAAAVFWLLVALAAGWLM